MAKNLKKTKASAITISNDIAKLFDAQMRHEMLKNGMRTSYRHLLHPLCIKDGVTQLDLVKVTKLKAPTVSTTLRNMEADGLVNRETDKDDARATRVFVTEKGRDIDKKVRAGNTKIEKAFLASLTTDEKEQLAVLLRKVKEAAEKVSGITADDITFED